MEFKELREYSVMISRYGCVVSTITGKELKHVSDKYGYLRVYAKQPDGSRKNLAVHRVLAIAFIPNPEGKPFINHIDGVKSNFSLNNLEWCSHKENMRHAKKLGLWTKEMGRGHIGPRDKIVHNLFSLGVSKETIEKAFELNDHVVNHILRKENARIS